MKVINIHDEEYPRNLLKIKNPPQKLYVEGNEKLLNNKSIAIVGSRNCSEYGIKYTKEFAKELANKNITIVSGLAIGIDGIAHDTAKDAKGNTIAVIGSGLNHIYPPENKELFRRILEKGGCIISEHEPNKEVDMTNFPKRNRIISGISDAILVIEARQKSGSTITGRLGLEEGKSVFCLPRDIGNTKGGGTNELIKRGAKLVTEARDILKEFGIENIKNNEKENAEEEKTQGELQEEIIIPKEYIEIYQFISYTPQNIQYFARRSGLKIAEVTQKLIMLELQGYIKSMPGNYYVRT